MLRHRFKSLREERITRNGYRLLWIHSTGKAISDDASRMKAIQKTFDDLSELRDRLQSPHSRMRNRLRVAGEVAKIMQRRGTRSLLQVEIIQEEVVTLKQKTPGRRSENTQYVREVKLHFDRRAFPKRGLTLWRRVDFIDFFASPERVRPLFG